MNELILPNSFILGAPKCGTTTLAGMLAQHPEVCVSEPKEPRYYIQAKHWIEGVDAYSKKHYAHFNGERVRIDAHPYNMMLGFVPDRIQLTCGNIKKFIICVRDPIARAYSAWNYRRNMRPGLEPRTFIDAIQKNLNDVNISWADFEGDYETQSDPKGGPYRLTYVEFGEYVAQLDKYKLRFPDAEFKFMFIDDLIENPIGYYNEVCEFLDLEAMLPIGGFEAKNVNEKRNGMWVADYYPDTFQLLVNEFYSGVMKLESITNRRLTSKWWGL